MKVVEPTAEEIAMNFGDADLDRRWSVAFRRNSGASALAVKWSKKASGGASMEAPE